MRSLIPVSLGPLVLALALQSGSGTRAPARRSRLDSLVVSHALAMTLQEGRLTGPGASFLLDEAARCQFVALGEVHDTAETPLIAGALFTRLHEGPGFQYAALEEGPFIIRLINASDIRGRLDSLVAISKRYPYGFAFMSDQDLALMEDIGRLSDAPESPIWGIDQAFGAAPGLERLEVSLPPSERASVEGLLQEVRREEAVRDLPRRHYMSSGEKGDVFEALLEQLGPEAGSEGKEILDALATSDRIYRAFREGAYYRNGHLREEYMKARFMEEYRAALHRRVDRPRVLVKLGASHLFRGLGPSRLQTLGDFLSQFAVANGTRSLHVALLPDGAPGTFGDLARFPDPVPALLARGLDRSHGWVVDLRRIRPHYRRILGEVPVDARDAFTRWLFGYDLVLFAGDMHPATYLLDPGVSL